MIPTGSRKIVVNVEDSADKIRPYLQWGEICPYLQWGERTDNAIGFDGKHWPGRGEAEEDEDEYRTPAKLFK